MEEISGKWYLCDPEKNTGCRGYRCGGRNGGEFQDGLCYCTTKRGCAKVTESGKRIRVRIFRKPGGAGWAFMTEIER